MKALPDIAKALIKWLFEHLGKALFSITAVAIVIYLGGIFHIYETTWIYAKTSLQLPTPLWATIVLVFLLGVYVYIRTSKFHSLSNTSKPKYYKYCPDCDIGINAKSPENYCQCGTKYLEKCPACSEKITRDSGSACSSCGHVFEMSSIPVD